MNLYKLHNIARKSFRLSSGDTLTRKKYSVNYLKELAEKYEIQEFLTLSYCCHGEDYNCWVEVEGLDYGWLFVDTDPAAMPQKLFDMVLGILKHYRNVLYKRKIYVVENEDCVQLYIFLRDICSDDFIITFGKKLDVEVGMYA